MAVEALRSGPTFTLAFPICATRPRRGSATAKCTTSFRTVCNSPACQRWRAFARKLTGIAGHSFRTSAICGSQRRVRPQSSKQSQAPRPTSVRNPVRSVTVKSTKDGRRPNGQCRPGPAEDPDAMIPDPSTNNVAKFTTGQAAPAASAWHVTCQRLQPRAFQVLSSHRIRFDSSLLL
jgi:hypothetical protein